MSEPIVFISHFKIKLGKGEGVTRLIQEVADGLEADKPRTVAFLVYSDEDGNKATFVHVFGDAQAMDSHFEGADQRASAAYEFIEP
jgi:quinol monooxygenase YgiN